MNCEAECAINILSFLLRVSVYHLSIIWVSLSNALMSSLDKDCLHRIYGRDTVPEIELHLGKFGKEYLSQSDISGLVQGVLGLSTVNIPWCSVKSAPLIRCLNFLLFENADGFHECTGDNDNSSSRYAFLESDESISLPQKHFIKAACRVDTTLQGFSILQERKIRSKRKEISNPSADDKAKSNLTTLIRQNESKCIPEFREMRERWIENAKMLKHTQEELRIAGFYELRNDLNEESNLQNEMPRQAHESQELPYPVLAMDCEMCLTSVGYELCRISVVDALTNRTLLDSFVKPKNEIVDYLTQFSGVTEEDILCCRMTLAQIQDILLREYIFKDSILVGHSLENDLRVLNVTHENIIDTSLLYMHPRGLPSRHALRYLAHRFLQRRIQTGQHDSTEDAIACADLLKLKMIHGPSYGNDNTGRRSAILNFLDEGIKCTLIGKASPIHAFLSQNPAQGSGFLNFILASTNSIATKRLHAAIQQTSVCSSGNPSLIFTNFSSLNAEGINKVVRDSVDILPRGAVTLVVILQKKSSKVTNSDSLPGVVGLHVSR